MIKELILYHLDSKVGIFGFDESDFYYFYYLSPFEHRVYSFPDFYATYKSSNLFPFLTNRIMKPTRPDYEQYLTRLNLTQGIDDTPYNILGKSGGTKFTDDYSLKVR